MIFTRIQLRMLRRKERCMVRDKAFNREAYLNELVADAYQSHFSLGLHMPESSDFPSGLN